VARDLADPAAPQAIAGELKARSSTLSSNAGRCDCKGAPPASPSSAATRAVPGTWSAVSRDATPGTEAAIVRDTTGSGGWEGQKQFRFARDRRGRCAGAAPQTPFQPSECRRRRDLGSTLVKYSGFTWRLRV
jgi:hypothetical protein